MVIAFIHLSSTGLGVRLDAISRRALWERGVDFGHGVGHGVGHFLNVHEFPPSIGYRQMSTENTMRKGMIVTIEPGYYETDNFGIRIENAYEMIEATNLESEATNFIAFRSLTWVPIQKSLIDKPLMTNDEVCALLCLCCTFLDCLVERLPQNLLGEDRLLLEET